MKVFVIQRNLFIGFYYKILATYDMGDSTLKEEFRGVDSHKIKGEISTIVLTV